MTEYQWVSKHLTFYLRSEMSRCDSTNIARKDKRCPRKWEESRLADVYYGSMIILLCKKCAKKFDKKLLKLDKKLLMT